MADIVVVDTNIFISALIGATGPSREILRRCLNTKLIPLISNALFLEYQDVTKRAHIRGLCPLTSSEIRELLNAFYSVCRWVPIYYLWRPNLMDEADNFLIELALAGNAQYIATNNISDFKNTELKFPDLRIVKPGQLLGEK